MPKYLLTIYDDESKWAAMAPEDAGGMIEQYRAYGDEATKKGVFVAGEGLQPTATATTVRVEDGQTMTTDGPYAETKEQLGGFYLLDCKDLDEAIEWASRIPSTSLGGAIEVRPIQELSQEG